MDVYGTISNVIINNLSFQLLCYVLSVFCVLGYLASGGLYPLSLAGWTDLRLLLVPKLVYLRTTDPTVLFSSSKKCAMLSATAETFLYSSEGLQSQ